VEEMQHTNRTTLNKHTKFEEK